MENDNDNVQFLDEPILRDDIFDGAVATAPTEEDIEPKDYFAALKSKITEVEFEALEANRIFIGREIEKATRLGQKNLTHKAACMWEILEKEMVLHATGYRKYVNRHDVIKMIDNVKPKNSVKIVELENYPRAIPDDNADAIEKARNLEIFDLFVVIYTDLTDEEVHTPAQKKFAARNKDPVVLGLFINDVLKYQHDRMYLITDWEDEFCDLTFTKMIEKMAEAGVKNPEKEITPSIDHINALVKAARLEVEESNKKVETFRHNIVVPSTPLKQTFTSRIVKFFKGE